MPLTLTIRNMRELDNGSPVALVLDRRGATIGRAATSDWCLPDPALHISSRHCEIRFNADRYELIDVSTNGTFLSGQQARLPETHVIGQGDVFMVGRFEIEARLDEAAAAAAAERNATPQAPEWQGWAAAAGQSALSEPEPSEGSSGWGSAKPSSPAPTGASSGWGSSAPSPAPAASGWGSTPAPADTGGWAAPATPSPPEPSNAPAWGASTAPASTPAASAWGSAAAPEANSPASTWDVTPAAAATPASPWSSPAAPALPPAADDIWGNLAASNVVDWARGGIGSGSGASTAPAPSVAEIRAPLVQPPMAAVEAGGATAPPVAQQAPAMAPNPAQAAPAAAPQDSSAVIAQFAGAAGLDPSRLSQGGPQVLAQAGDLLRRLVSGLVVLMEARARAKSQLGAQGTSLEFDGNNPLKFARTPEQALMQLLNPPERGFMSTERAVEDAYKDLQAHQVATLMAMQGALRTTLDRFSPTAISSRAETKGLLNKILPGKREATLWKAYEREFSGVAKGSDEAFMDMFAKEFRRAYEELAHKR